MAEHTPGPWGWERFKTELGVLERYPIALSGLKPGTDVLLATEDQRGRVHIRVSPADEALLAAAPDLLAACEAYVRGIDSGNEPPGSIGQIHSAMRRAVAKARGAT